MKKLFLLVAAMFAAVSFSACSDDDDNKIDKINELLRRVEEIGRASCRERV